MFSPQNSGILRQMKMPSMRQVGTGSLVRLKWIFLITWFFFNKVLAETFWMLIIRFGLDGNIIVSLILHAGLWHECSSSLRRGNCRWFLFIVYWITIKPWIDMESFNEFYFDCHGLLYKTVICYTSSTGAAFIVFFIT